MNYKTSIATIAAALALYASAGCGKDEPVVIRPISNTCRDNCDHNRYVHAKPARNISLKNNVYAAPTGVQYIIVVPRQAPELSRYNSFNDPNARENARNVVGARDRRQHPLGGSWVINPGTSGSTPAQTAGSSTCPPCPPQGSGSTDACYDPSRTMQERGRACAQRLPTADEVFGPESQPSLEQRLREAEELNRDLEQQITDSMNPNDDHGRG